VAQRVLMKGNEAIAEAAIQGGCQCFFSYPVTPQNEIPEYMSRELPKRGGLFLEAEAEFAAINMVYGAAASGARVMTSSSGSGISLKAEGISCMACAQLPCVIVNIMRGGPALSDIDPAQGDYLQAAKGIGHGDLKLPVLAPASIQEACDLMMEAFDLADIYTNPVMVLGDGMIGQMMEPVEFKEPAPRQLPPKDWALTGKGSHIGVRRVITSADIDPKVLEAHNLVLDAKYKEIEAREIKFEEYRTEGAELIFVAYGTMSRIVKNTIRMLEELGIRTGLIRPITLWPFPKQAILERAGEKRVRAVLAVEMSPGQMVEDVRIAVNGVKPVHFYGKAAGVIPRPGQIIEEVRKILGK
jgi:2-oxoglutarate ferredoxin oxidoreductase subunit alpha